MKIGILLTAVVAFAGASLWAVTSDNLWAMAPLMIVGIGLVAYARYTGETDGK